MLIAGATGSGKSVTIHAILTSLLYRNSPDDLKFIMIDPKRVELTLYNKIPHLLTNVITDPKKAILSLKWAGKEMERRYEILEKYTVRDIKSYQDTVVKPALESLKNKVIEPDQLPPAMPYIIVVIDELADIMQAYPRELESAIVRLAQMSRAVGIHLILSTQRPSVNVITGLIKANVPTRLALQVASQIDSRTILDMPGAEKLLGAGDMLFMSGEMAKPIRIQSAFISETEVKKVAEWLASNYESEVSDLKLEDQTGVASILESLEGNGSNADLDDLFEDAKQAVVSAGKGSTSYIQRKLGVGYARAARLMDQLEEQGIIGPENGSKPREVLIGGPGQGVHEYSPEDNQSALNRM
jgi:S-DNA-T family DNA segregation ATPase FtsK/SpoIIIE